MGTTGRPVCFCMAVILLPAACHGKSSRGTPRLRRTPRALHGALRLALRANNVVSPFSFVACAHDLPLGSLSSRLCCELQGWTSCSPQHHVVVLGAYFLNGALFACEALAYVGSLGPLHCSKPASSADSSAALPRCGLFSSRQQAHFLLAQQTAAFLMPNVRAKRATTAGPQARAGENVLRTARPGLGACRWRSA